MIQPKKIRNPFYADYNPGYMDSLDQFKNSFRPEGNFSNPKQTKEIYQPEMFENNQVYQGDNIPQNYYQKSNDLSKNFANFYGVTPPPTGYSF